MRYWRTINPPRLIAVEIIGSWVRTRIDVLHTLSVIRDPREPADYEFGDVLEDVNGLDVFTDDENDQRARQLNEVEEVIGLPRG